MRSKSTALILIFFGKRKDIFCASDLSNKVTVSSFSFRLAKLLKTRENRAVSPRPPAEIIIIFLPPDLGFLVL